MLPLQKKGKNSYCVRLNKDIYRQVALDRLLQEDKDWVRRLPTKDKNYYHCELTTPSFQDVLEWLNYLFYLNKTA
jgi:hypothetical protein